VEDKMKLQNPFITTGYISPEYFCNREDETNRLIKDIKGFKNTTLFSLRRLGKTGLIQHCINHLKNKEKVKCIYFDILMTENLQDFVNEFGKAFLNQAMPFSKKILENAKKLFSAFVPIATTDPVSGSLSIELKIARPEAVQYDLEKLMDYIKNSNEKYFIAIDEFQQIVNYHEKNTEALLRSKIQFMNNCSFVFSGSKKEMIISMFASQSRPFYQSTGFLELMPIGKEEYIEFITTHFSSNKITIDSEALDNIFKFSRGITYYIQLICHDLYDSGEKKITVKKVSETIHNIVQEKESYFINYTNLLTKKQYDILKAIAKEEGIDKPTGSGFLNKHSLGSASTVSSALDVLVEKEALYKKDGMYLVSDVLFAEWLKSINK
jgi:uncharacterized protein